MHIGLIAQRHRTLGRIWRQSKGAMHQLKRAKQLLLLQPPQRPGPSGTQRACSTQ
jgi:hypothetical protein